MIATVARRLVGKVEPGEWPAAAWSFVYFFCLLAAYYVLRPVREEMAIQGGVRNLQWLFTAVFLTMLAVVPVFGWLSARFPRRVLLPAVYGFFAVNLVGFHLAMGAGLELAWVGRVFFVWLSVFNLFVVSVFWSFMADLFRAEQARRLYGLIAAGGSLGAICGPLLTALLVGPLGPANLLLISALLLTAAIGCIAMLSRWAAQQPVQSQTAPHGEALGGGVWAGLTTVLRTPYLLAICLYLFCYTLLSTVLYFQQAEIVSQAITDSRERTRLFAAVDATINTLTLLTQVLLFSRLTSRFGVTAMLAAMPVLSIAGFALLGAAPVLAVLIVFGVARRVGEFAISKPVRETLFNALPREQKYKAKNVIDTVVYRGGDTVSGWLFSALRGAGLGLGAIAWTAVPVAGLWLWVSFYLGRRAGEKG